MAKNEPSKEILKKYFNKLPPIREVKFNELEQCLSYWQREAVCNKNWREEYEQYLKEIYLFVKTEICEPCNEGEECEFESCDECNMQIILELTKCRKRVEKTNIQIKRENLTKQKNKLDEIFSSDSDFCENCVAKDKCNGSCCYEQIKEMLGYDY